jgi:hypothetical protein
MRVLHALLLSVRLLSVCLSGTAPRLLTGTACGMGHREAGVPPNDARDAEAAQMQAELNEVI